VSKDFLVIEEHFFLTKVLQVYSTGPRFLLLGLHSTSWMQTRKAMTNNQNIYVQKLFEVKTHHYQVLISPNRVPNDLPLAKEWERGPKSTL
jgi:hypothetical protein